MTPALLLLAIAQFDTTLPEDLRPVVKRAIEAELDPKRGTGNAVEIIKAERAKQTDQQKQLALDLRMASVVLRKRFVTVEEFPVPIRYEQALSTYSRLELSDPGLREWIEDALKHHDYAKKRIGTKKQRVIKAAILTRAGLDKARVAKPFQELIRNVGFELVLVPSEKEATIVIKVSAEDAPPEKNLRMVKVQLGLESIRDGKVIWQQGIYRTEGGVDANEAIDRAVNWLAKVGGRDLFFRWLGETAFHSFLQGPPGRKSDPHETHGFEPHGEQMESELKVKVEKK